MSTSVLVEPSPVRAWFALVGFSLRRQLQARLMLFVALGLLLLALALVGMQTMRTRWSSAARRYTYVVATGKPQKDADWKDQRQLEAKPGPNRSTSESRTLGQISDQTMFAAVVLKFPPRTPIPSPTTKIDASRSISSASPSRAAAT